jgi:hypothetical protein
MQRLWRLTRALQAASAAANPQPRPASNRSMP